MTEISEAVHHEGAATLAEALRLRAALSPERRAYTFLADGEDEAEHLNYGQLDERARAIAAALRRTCGPGDRALLLFPPGLDFVAAFFGCLYAGVIAVPAFPPRSSLTPRSHGMSSWCWFWACSFRRSQFLRVFWLSSGGVLLFTSPRMPVPSLSALRSHSLQRPHRSSTGGEIELLPKGHYSNQNITCIV